MSEDPTFENFPQTQWSILRDAAQGRWARFFASYLRPCWAEVMIACRTAGISVTDSEDVFQELIVRVITDGRFSPRLRSVLQEHDPSADFCGNLPAKYLKYRDLPLASVRFRTYLKGLIRNVIRESVRRQRGRPRSLEEFEGGVGEVSFKESISQSLDHRFVVDCLFETVCRLRDESKRAPTKGARRLFAVLAMSVVERSGPSKIADRLQIDRTTVSGLLRRARCRFVELLKQVTSISDTSLLKAAISRSPAALAEAFVRAREEAGLDAKCFEK